MDLDQSGRGFQRVRTYLGPSLGWIDELVQPSVEITTAGTYAVKPGDSVILVNVAAAVTIQLPDVTKWWQQAATQPATAFDRSITIKDLGGNANNFNIVVAPFVGQQLDDIQQQIVISTARAVFKFIPLVDMSGWIVEQASVGGGGSGGGDVFKAGDNTYTGANIFQGQVTVPEPLPNDISQKPATTSWVTAQNYLVSASLTGYAQILDPTFEGDPRAPTPLPGNDSTSIATTHFVNNALGSYQPLDPDLTSVAAATGSGAGPTPSGLYYRRSPGDWQPLNLAGISIDTATNTIAVSIGGGNVTAVNFPQANQLAQWTGGNTIQGIDISALGYAPLASPAFTGNPTAPTPGNTDNDTSIATTAFVKNTSQPLDGDLTAIAALTGTNTIYYRSAPDVWSPVVIGSNMSFASGVLNSVSFGTVPEAPNDGNAYVRQSLGWTSITGTYQPLDADLTSIAAQTAFGTGPTNSGLFYRKSADTWVPLNLSGLTINGTTNTLIAAAGGASVTIADIAPSSPNQGDLWWESDTGSLFMRYNDINSQQWVNVGAGAIGAPLNSPVFTGDPQAPTPTIGDNDTSIATTAFVQSAILASVKQPILAKTSAYSVVAGDLGAIINVSGTFVLSHAITAATAGAGFSYWVRNTGLGTITIDPNGAETIDGSAQLLCLAKQNFQVVCDGTNWFTIGRQSKILLTKLTLNGGLTAEFKLPPDYTSFEIERSVIFASSNASYAQFATDNVPTWINSGYYAQFIYTTGTSAGITNQPNTSQLQLDATIAGSFYNGFGTIRLYPGGSSIGIGYNTPSLVAITVSPQDTSANLFSNWWAGYAGAAVNTRATDFRFYGGIPANVPMYGYATLYGHI